MSNGPAGTGTSLSHQEAAALGAPWGVRLRVLFIWLLALVLGIAVGTVRSRLFRGRRLLQDLLFVFARDAGFDFPKPAPDDLTASSPTEPA
jgi:hypothetical protein